MTNPYSGQIFSELVSGNLLQPDQITGPYICIVGAASSGPSYTLRRISSSQEAANLFESGGDTDTPFLRDISLALQQGGGAITLYAMRIGGTRGSLTFTQDTTNATLKITPMQEDKEIFEKYKVVLSESELDGGQRVIIYDDELDAVVYDSDLIIVPDLGLMKVEISSDWDGYYTLGLDSNGLLTDIDGNAPTLDELESDIDASVSSFLLSSSHSNATYAVGSVSKVEASDGKELSKPEMYAALDKAYSMIATRYMDYIVPAGAYFDAANMTDTEDGRDHSLLTASLIRSASDIDWSSKPVKGSSDDVLGFLWQYKYKGTKYSFMSTTQELFENTTLGDEVAYVNTTEADVVGGDLEFMNAALKVLLDGLTASVASETLATNVEGLLTTFDVNNSSTYGALFGDTSSVAAAVLTGLAATQAAAYALIDAARLKVGFEITLEERAKYLTFEDSAGSYHKINKVIVQVKRDQSDSAGNLLAAGTAELSELESEIWNATTGELKVLVRYNAGETGASVGVSVATSDCEISVIKAALESSPLVNAVAYETSAPSVTVADVDKIFPQINGTDCDSAASEISVGRYWLSHKELLGEEIPSKVWSKFLDEGSNSQLREVNFGHQLAQFCYYSSTSYHMCLGFISFSKPEAFNRIDLANYMGALPEYQGWGGKLTDEAILSTGEGILGNKFLGGSLGYRGNTLKGGSGLQGYAFGGLVCTKGLSLPNKQPYGISQSDEKKDANKSPVDIGRHIVVSAAWPTCSFGFNSSASTARHSISALLAAKVFTTPVNQEPFGQVKGALEANLLLTDSEQQLVADGYAGDCRIARITMLDTVGGVNYITNISTAAHWKDDYKRISTIRCVNRVVNGLRNLAKNYIGSSFSSAMITSLQSRINGYLKSERDVGVHQGAVATLSFTRADRINGNLKITLKMIPPFSLETITITTSVAADASEL